jgi:hypothetical protein
MPTRSPSPDAIDACTIGSRPPKLRSAALIPVARCPAVFRPRSCTLASGWPLHRVLALLHVLLRFPAQFSPHTPGGLLCITGPFDDVQAPVFVRTRARDEVTTDRSYRKSRHPILLHEDAVGCPAQRGQSVPLCVLHARAAATHDFERRNSTGSQRRAVPPSSGSQGSHAAALRGNAASHGMGCTKSAVHLRQVAPTSYYPTLRARRAERASLSEGRTGPRSLRSLV